LSATTGVAVVRSPVAIVVETVANLRRRRLVLLTLQAPGNAVLGAGGTHARQTGIAAATTLRVVLIRDIVAVVVETVTQLARVGIHGGLAIVTIETCVGQVAVAVHRDVAEQQRIDSEGEEAALENREAALQYDDVTGNQSDVSGRLDAKVRTSDD
jgi:electron transfer flavoprotein alpha subunit